VHGRKSHSSPGIRFLSDGRLIPLTLTLGRVNGTEIETALTLELFEKPRSFSERV